MVHTASSCFTHNIKQHEERRMEEIESDFKAVQVIYVQTKKDLTVISSCFRALILRSVTPCYCTSCCCTKLSALSNLGCNLFKDFGDDINIRYSLPRWGWMYHILPSGNYPSSLSQKNLKYRNSESCRCCCIYQDSTLKFWDLLVPELLFSQSVFMLDNQVMNPFLTNPYYKN